MLQLHIKRKQTMKKLSEVRAKICSLRNNDKQNAYKIVRKNYGYSIELQNIDILLAGVYTNAINRKKSYYGK